MKYAESPRGQRDQCPPLPLPSCYQSSLFFLFNLLSAGTTMEEREQKSEKWQIKVESERVLSTGEVSSGRTRTTEPRPTDRWRFSSHSSAPGKRHKGKKAMICSDCFSSSGPDSSPPLCEVSIYNRRVLFVCLSRKMSTLPNGLKSSSLVVAISFFKNCNKKYSLWIARTSEFFFEFLILKKTYF